METTLTSAWAMNICHCVYSLKVMMNEILLFTLKNRIATTTHKFTAQSTCTSARGNHTLLLMPCSCHQPLLRTNE